MPLLSKSAAIAVLSASIFAHSSHAATRYVNIGLTTGADNGTSWSDAYRTVDGVSRALTAATSGDEIWVASGTYKPTALTTRTIGITLRTGIGVYGGFAGTETARDQRNFASNITTLSGDLAGNDPVVTDNSYHVVIGTGVTATGILDGFTITAGNANGATASDQDKGGGLIFLSGTASIRNCRIVNNRVTFGGGGTYIRTASPTFADCTWQSNNGGSFGGAIDMFNGCSPTFTRCSFISNTAVRAGGVEVFGNCFPTFVNCLFRNNVGGAQGGGALFCASTSTATLRNCTLVRNTTTGTGSGVLNNASSTALFNSIVYFNTGAGGTTANQLTSGSTATYSCVQGGFTGTGNISAAPQFVADATGDMHLLPTSPCIDAAANANAGAGNTLDLDRLPRFVDAPSVPDTGVGTPPIIDMGAYEFQPPAIACDGIDFNNDTSLFDPVDIDAFLSVYSEGPCIPAGATCNDIDFNNDTSVFDPCDIASLLLVYSEGPCTLCGQ